MTYKRIYRGFFAAAALIFSLSVHSQNSQTPAVNAAIDKASQSWKWMDVVSFNLNAQSKMPAASQDNQNLAQKIWKKEIDSASNGSNGYKYPVIILISNFNDDGINYTFSILNTRMTISGCTPPGNGSGIVDIFSTCPLNITAKDLATGRIASQGFDDYCHLYFNTSDFPAEKNHTEISIDKEKGMAYFRVIQHEKIVPECNKFIKYKGG